jgi:predicted alpha-1,6-mannanase (GH76 family)
MTSHRPYIDAVGAAMADRVVPIVTAVTTRIAGRPEALLRLAPQATETAFADAASVDLRWDEERGWRCVVSYPPDSVLADRSVDLGGEALVQPTAVADWVSTVLADPDQTADGRATPRATAGTGAARRTAAGTRQVDTPLAEYVDAAA